VKGTGTTAVSVAHATTPGESLVGEGNNF